ncbi:YeeE/YedE family protein [Streptomyces sp. NPDC127091]|uniref:YeeE/YedE family protein n=1 Tax=Streptomyces sp. NPDC127091 TaxID=3347134 RepID=UPI00364E2333
MSTYWPWWAGAVGLALVTVTYTLLTDRSFGVSSAWDRVLHWRSERRIERMDEEFADDRTLADALAAATAEHFGTRPGSGSGSGSGVSTSPPVAYGKPQPLESDSEPTPSESPSAASLRPVPLVTQAALLVSIFLGGLIAAVASGRFQLRFDMGPGFKDLVTADPAAMIGLLFLGGVLVGFGTRLAGGCSSGHGLSGCGRLRPVSIVATAVFFGTAVAVSFLLWKVI